MYEMDFTYTLPFKMFLKEVTYVHQGCIYLKQQYCELLLQFEITFSYLNVFFLCNSLL